MIILGKQKGFTLVELIIVTVIIAFIGVGAVEMLRLGAESQIIAEKSQTAAWDGQVALNRLTEDLHSIKSAANISTATATALTFTSYNGNTISYALSGGQLLRNSLALANNVTGLAFSYFDASGNATTTIADIRYIGVNFTINNGISYGFTTGVFVWGTA
jgi:prepilin-type N-terminal cleavage/methylation domain-containing protein